MNAHYWIRRLLGRATCVLAPGAKLLPSARIFNARGVNEAIRIGAHSRIHGDLLVFGHGGQIDIGEWCFIGEGARVWSSAAITIGDRTVISHNVNIFDSQTHPLSAAARHQQYVDSVTTGPPRTIDLGERPVVIEHDVMIAAAATILRGVTIGRGSIIGAGSVVTRDVAPFSIMAGNPARFIRELTPDER